jgi:hypothetical protein
LHAAPTLVPPTHAFDDAQSVSDEHPWNVAFGPQNCSNGPPPHVPLFAATQVLPGHSELTVQSALMFVPPAQVFAGEHTVSEHWLNAVAAPGTLQAPPGHCELLVHELPGHCEATVHGAPTFVPPAHVKPHAVPLFVPPMHRRPPHTVAPTATQSALLKHGVAARLLQVSQRHFAVVKPGARQLGLAAVSVTVCCPVELLRLIGSDATTAPLVGGQSRLVLPQNRFGELPFTSHVRPAFCPASHVPLRTPSFGVASPTQRGHGFGFGPV